MALSRTALVKVRADMSQYQREMAKSGTATSTLSRGLKTATVGMGSLAVAGGAVAAAMIVGPTKAFANFDAQMNKSLAIMGDVTEMQRGAMSDAARQVGLTTSKSATEAAESYFFLASAGLDAEQSIAALPVVAKFAQAGMFDMATATDLATDAQSALGLSVDDASENLQNLTRVTDVLVKANTLANANVQQFSESLTNKAGNALRVLNKDVEEGAAVLAVYADQGLKGAAAGEALGIVLRDLQRSALSNAADFRQFGIEVFDAGGNMRNIADIIEDVEQATGGMSDATRKATLAQLGFQERSVQQILALLGTSSAIRGYEASLRAAAGTTDEVAEKQLKTLNEQFGLLKDRAIDAGIGLGESLAPEVEALIPDLERTIDNFAEIAENVGPLLITVLHGVADAMSAVNAATSLLTGSGGVGKLNTLIKELDEGMGEGLEPTVRFSAALGTLANTTDRTTQKIGAFTLVSPLLGGVFALMTSGSKVTADAILELAAATDLSGAALDSAITDAIRNADALGLNTEEVMLLRDARLELQAELDGAADVWSGDAEALEHLGGATEGAGSAADDAVDPFEELVEETKTFAEAATEAAEAQQSLADTIREFTDPVFAAAKSMERLQEAQAKVDELNADGKEGTDEWAAAQLELASQTVETQGALDAVSPESLEVALSTIEEALGFTSEEAAALLEQLDLIDGKTVTAVIDLQTVTSNAATNISNTGSTELDDKLFFNSTGGGVTQSVTPISQSTSSVTVNVNSPNTFDLARDIQFGVQTAGLVGAVENLVSL